MEFGVNNVNFSGKFDKTLHDIVKEKRQNVKLKQEPDSAEFSAKKNKKEEKKFTLKKFVKLVLAFYAAAFAATAIASVGRNPGKAAKVLRGTSEIVNPAYKKGSELLENLMSKSGESYKTSFDDILAMFKPEKNSTKLADFLDDVDDLIQKHAIEPDSKVTEAISNLRANLQKFTAEIQTSLAKGEDVSIYDKTGEFDAQNSKYGEVISDFLDDFRYNKMDFNARYSEEGKAVNKLGKNFSIFLRSAAEPKKIITECPKDILDTTQIFYHGTTNAGKVYKNGFSPYVSNQLSKAPRELGAGIYLTPDRQVAASFCQLKGNIIPVKLDGDAKVALVDETMHKAYTGKIAEFISERIPQAELEKLPGDEKNAMIELLCQKAFKEAGFDAAYIPKAVRAGGLNLFGADVNKMFGTKQSQLILFTPEKLEITPRTLKDRVADLGIKLKSAFNIMKYMKDNPLAGLGI